jgi:hypothetical protein
MKLADTELWENILLAIEDGQVVPIVGRDLLLVDTDAGPRPFHQLVAARLAAELKVPADALPPEFETNDVACAYKDFRGDPSNINASVVRIIKGLKVPVPEPLRLLAEIPKFRLFVSTTIDTLLEDAIAAVRGRKPAVLTFPPSANLLDFDEKLLDNNGTFVFQILGRVSTTSPFAVTEGQMLEQMHDFMSGNKRPDKLIYELQQSHLLVVGVDFPDWLARFLLRLSRAKPLWDSRQMTEVFADSRASQAEFTQFLHHFSPQQSQVFEDGTPIDFVHELHRLWFERHPPGGTAVDEADQTGAQPAPMESGSVFISYANEDRSAAFRLADQLIAKGLEVWVDRRLNPGDEFRPIIERHIRECSAFVPVLSRNTQMNHGRWFRGEWKLACDLNREFFGTDRKYLFPVVVDDTANNDLIEFRSNLFGTSAVRAPGGTPPDVLCQQLDQAQKAHRKQFARA